MKDELILRCISLIGVEEFNNGSNPIIKNWFETFSKRLGRNYSHLDDGSLAWCAIFVWNILNDFGIEVDILYPERAKAYLDFGGKVELYEASVGDLVILNRGKPSAPTGHIGFFLGSSKDKVCLLSGNFGNKVSVDWFEKTDVVGVVTYDLLGVSYKMV